jgi:hypothetical protein
MDTKKAETVANARFIGLLWMSLDYQMVPAPGFELGTY